MATLSKEQLDAYFDRISFPRSKLPMDPNSLEHLAMLQRYQLSAIPFESLGLHYSTNYVISTHLEDIYDKQIGRRRGGYCMENNALFLAVMRTLGFQAYSAGARVSESTRGRKEYDIYGGWSHQVSIVTVGGTRYLVDVGFGPTGPTQPMPLRNNEQLTTISPAVAKLEYRRLKQHSDESQRSWVFNFKQDEQQAEWTEAYMFTEQEFFPEDFEVMNLSTHVKRQTIFFQKVIVQRMILSEDEHDVVGVVVLFENTLKKRIHGKTEVDEVLKSERERFEALDKWFGIRLNDREKSSIKYMQSEIHGSS